MTRRSVPTRIAGGALAVVIAAMLSGCFANPLDALIENATEDTAKNAAEEMIEGLTGGEAGLEFGELPDDFPAEITLVSDNVVQSMTMAEGTMVIVMDPRSKDELVAQVKQDFADWEEVMSSDLGELVSHMYEKGDLAVTATVMAHEEGDEGTMVSYTVITQQEE